MLGFSGSISGLGEENMLAIIINMPVIMKAVTANEKPVAKAPKKANKPANNSPNMITKTPAANKGGHMC